MRKTVLLAMVCMLVLAPLSAKGKAEVQKKVTVFTNATYYNESWYNTMNRDFEAETGIAVDAQPIAGNEDDFTAKVNIDLIGGSDIDVVFSFGPKNFFSRVDAGFFLPLASIVREHGIDAVALWGANLPIDARGEFYGLPYKQEMYCVFYNKTLFDQASVPYPVGPWTWDEYIETAKRLTNPAKGIYGSFMNADNPWMFFPAKQQGIAFYTEDGMSNFADPAFGEAILWFNGLDGTIQPSVASLMADNASWNYYALKGDRLAMFPQGNWFTRLLNSQGDYPHTWKYGIAPMPSAGSGGANNLVSFAFVSINKNAEHKQEAVAYALWLAENQWRYEGGVPALATLTEAQQAIAFSAIAEASDGQLTVSDLYENLVNTGLGAQMTDLIGPAAVEYNTIIKEELRAFNMGLQTVDVTIDAIVRRANEAIAIAR